MNQARAISEIIHKLDWYMNKRQRLEEAATVEAQAPEEAAHVEHNLKMLKL